jgi:hypothetical protein
LFKKVEGNPFTAGSFNFTAKQPHPFFSRKHQELSRLNGSAVGEFGDGLARHVMSAGKEYTMCLRKAAIIRKTAIMGDCFVELVELTVQAFKKLYMFFVGARINNMPPCLI